MTSASRPAASQRRTIVRCMISLRPAPGSARARAAMQRAQPLILLFAAKDRFDPVAQRKRCQVTQSLSPRLVENLLASNARPFLERPVPTSHRELSVDDAKSQRQQIERPLFIWRETDRFAWHAAHFDLASDRLGRRQCSDDRACKARFRFPSVRRRTVRNAAKSPGRLKGCQWDFPSVVFGFTPARAARLDQKNRKKVVLENLHDLSTSQSAPYERRMDRLGTAYRFERPQLVGGRERTSRWRCCPRQLSKELFGETRGQPHRKKAPTLDSGQGQGRPSCRKGGCATIRMSGANLPTRVIVPRELKPIEGRRRGPASSATGIIDFGCVPRVFAALN